LILHFGTRTLRFYRRNNLWYINVHLTEFILVPKVVGLELQMKSFILDCVKDMLYLIFF